MLRNARNRLLRPLSEAQRHHELIDPHRRLPWLVDVILGAQDGLVNVLGVVLGVAAATGSAQVVLVAGLAAGVAEAVSMAAVAYTSTAAAGDLYSSERAREYRHIEAVPELERAEIRAIYERKGFSGDLLERIVEAITSNKDVWVAVMMTEEHGLTEIDRRKSLRSAVIVGLASLVGSLVPLVPFMILPVRLGAWASCGLTAAGLFAVGYYKARVTIGRALQGGLSLAMIGLISALIGYVIGAVLQIPATP